MSTESITPLLGNRPESTDARIGRMVEVLLDLLGLQKQELAERVGMKPANLSKKIGGVVPWSASEVEKVAAALGFPIALLHVDPDEVAASLRTPGRSINYRSA